MRGITWPAVHAGDDPQERSDKRRCATAARQKINDRRAAEKFKYLLAANFGASDYVVTLTYKDGALPATPELAKRKNLAKFIRQLRSSFKRNGEELRYLHVTEGLHGDHRIHHHMVLPGIPGIQEIVRSHWICNGENVGFDRLDLKSYGSWGQYLTKEPREKGRRYVGDHMWSASRNIRQPTIEKGDMKDHMALTAPPGAVILQNDTIRNEHGEYQYIEYLLPEKRCKN